MINTFHLSLPVTDADATRHFYCHILGGVHEKATPGWFNIILHGHQLTFHHAAEHIGHAGFHWGLNIPWDDFHFLHGRLKDNHVRFIKPPDYQEVGTPGERVKMVFCDPNGYQLEYKAYRYSGKVAMAGEQRA